MKNKRTKIKKYEEGDFISDNSAGISAGLGFLSGIAGLGMNPRRPSGLQSGAQGALSGAAAGVSFGPLGIAGGALLGGLGSIFSAKKQRDLIRAQDKQFVNDTLDYNQSNMNTNNKNMYGSSYADGDMVQQNRINIEKGELQIDPKDGKVLRTYKGINPETGGLYEDHAKKVSKESSHNIVTAEPGTFIITKKLSSKYEDAINNNDKLTQNTILMNIRNNKELKGNTGLPVPQFASGGGVGRRKNQPLSMYGNAINPYNTLSSQALIGGNPVASTYIQDNSIYDAAGARADRTSQLGNLLNDSKPSLLNKVGNYLPAVSNIAQGLFGRTEQLEYAKPINNPYKSQILNNLPQDIDVNPAINDMYRSNSVAENNLANNSNSSSVYRANRLQLQSNLSRNIAGLRTNAALQNNGIAQARASIYNNLGQQDMQQQQYVQQYNQGVDQFNIQNRAAKQNLLNTGLGQLQQTSQNDQNNEQLRNTDLYRLSLLRDMNPFAKYYKNLGGNGILEDQYKKGGMVSTRKSKSKK